MLYKPSFSLRNDLGWLYPNLIQRVSTIRYTMRFSLLIAALGGIAGAVPLGANAPTHVAEALAPRQTRNPEHVSYQPQAICVHSSDMLSDGMHPRLRAALRTDSPMHAPVRPGMQRSVPSLHLTSEGDKCIIYLQIMFYLLRFP